MTLRDEEEAQAEDRDETSAGRRPKAKNALARQQTTRRRRKEAASSFAPEPWQSQPAPGPERSHLPKRTEAGHRNGKGISPKNLRLEAEQAAADVDREMDSGSGTSSRGSRPPPGLLPAKPPPPTTHPWRSRLWLLCIQGRDSHHDRRREPKPSTGHTTMPDADCQSRRNGINPKTGTAGERQRPSPQANPGRSGKSTSSRPGTTSCPASSSGRPTPRSPLTRTAMNGSG